METQKTHCVIVEWFDDVLGVWADLGEARNYERAQERIAGLRASDIGTGAQRRYRIVETTITEER